jgi:hypothetical protein
MRIAFQFLIKKKKNIIRSYFNLKNKTMATVEQKMKEFKSKSYDEKLKISMNIITNLKDR